MKKTILFILLLLSTIARLEAMAVSDSTARVLQLLDRTIEQKETYHARLEQRIGQLKKQLHASTDPRKQYDLCGSLFTQYLHYQADSSLYYIQRKRELLPQLQLQELESDVIINTVEVMGVIGMYNEALLELKKIHPNQLSEEQLAYYYRTCRAYCGWLADYTPNKATKSHYQQITDAYRDSILLMTSSQIPDRDIVLAEKKLLAHRPEEAIAILQHYACDKADLKHHAFHHYTFAEAYGTLGETDPQIYHLAKAAVCDLQRAVREYASLQKLAKLMYDEGDYERAYRYLTCSMEDAVACNARLRFLEVTEFYPIIDRAYQAQLREKHVLMRNMLICVSVLVLLLIVSTVYLYYWMKKLQVMRRHLHEANRQLVSTNQNLEEAGKIKEAYIGRYLDKCVGYLDKLEQYRRSLEKLAMASKIDDLFKAIRSEQFLHDERKTFYYEFDKSFLELFPHFIEDFNGLLLEEGKIFPKKNELLNTELRIFALIRLGVTDSTRIAHFLGYSLTTVYNYRSKVRNKASGDKERFEQQVMRL